MASALGLLLRPKSRRSGGYYVAGWFGAGGGVFEQKGDHLAVGVTTEWVGHEGKEVFRWERMIEARRYFRHVFEDFGPSTVAVHGPHLSSWSAG